MMRQRLTAARTALIMFVCMMTICASRADENADGPIIAKSKDILTKPTIEDISELVKNIRTEGDYGADQTTAATNALIRLGKPAIPAFVDLGIHDPFDSRSNVITALAQIDSDAVHKVEIENGRLFKNVDCQGVYRHHLQGICTNDKTAIFWSFTTTLVKSDVDGKVLKQIDVPNHHGDLCYRDDRLYVAVNLGRFNDPEGKADSWVYVYTSENLSLIAKHEVQEVFHGAGGIGYRDDHFFVVGGLPDGIKENYVYQYDAKFNFVKKHIIKSGHTRLGIQTAAYARGKWMFGCYGDPKILLVTDADFNLLGRYEFDCSLGIVGLPTGRFLAATGRCEKEKGCTAAARIGDYNKVNGLKIVLPPK